MGFVTAALITAGISGGVQLWGQHKAQKSAEKANEAAGKKARETEAKNYAIWLAREERLKPYRAFSLATMSSMFPGMKPVPEYAMQTDPLAGKVYDPATGRYVDRTPAEQARRDAGLMGPDPATATLAQSDYPSAPSQGGMDMGSMMAGGFTGGRSAPMPQPRGMGGPGRSGPLAQAPPRRVTPPSPELQQARQRVMDSMRGGGNMGGLMT
jgi:hypothetical protein